MKILLKPLTWAVKLAMGVGAVIGVMVVGASVGLMWLVFSPRD